MEINKVLLIQKLAENKMRYILELTGMPDFVADENGHRSKVIHCTAFMEVETNIFDDSKKLHCRFAATDEFDHIYNYKFDSVAENIFAINIMDQFVDKIAPVFPVVECGKTCTFKEYEALVKETVKFSYIQSSYLTFGVPLTFGIPFGVEYAGGIITDIRDYPDNTLFTELKDRRIFKANGRVYREKVRLNNPSITTIKKLWPNGKIDDNDPKTWTFIVSEAEELIRC